MKKLLTILASALFIATTVRADVPVYWPDEQYDPAIPSIKDALGYESGSKITWHADLIRYFKALEQAAPDRVKIFSYGKSWEGRELIYVAISSADNIANLDSFQAGMQKLADPRTTSDAEAEQLISSLPGSVWLAYGVHGNEISSPDAAMRTAYHLLAATQDSRAKQTLDDSVVFIAPLLNPDGRDRFIHRFESAMGMEADSDPISAEHNEPWPSGRTNHYLFDMNRDWIVLTQPEIRNQVAELQKWYPLTFVDLHEMGGNSSYYFAPEAVPYNPHLIDSQRDSLWKFGQNNAKWFDNFGMDYFTRDIFDAFYPGYGASWPAYYGAVSMTYEQGSSRGLVYRRYDGSDLTYNETVRGHFVSSLSTAETVAVNHQELLRNFYEYQKSAIAEGRSEKGKRTYIFPATSDKDASRRLMGLLTAQGVEVTRASESFNACRVSYDAGAFIIDSAQPRKRLLRVLLEDQVDMEEGFLAETERKRQKNIDHDIYDVTAWSLQKMFNVDMNLCGSAVNVAGERVSSDRFDPGTVTNADATVAYLVPWTDMAAGRLLTSALRKGLSVKTNNAKFVHQGREFGRGTLIFDVADNDENLGAALQEIASATGAEVIGVDNSWIDSGMDFGSRAVSNVLPPKVAIAWDDPTNQYSAGNTRFVIERQFGYPVTAIRTQHLSRADLSRYDVLILPSTWWGYQQHLGGVADMLKDWVSKGGVLIANGNATRFLSDEKNGLLDITREAQIKPDMNTTKAENGIVPGTEFTSLDEMKQAIEPANELPDSVPGILANAGIDEDHWITAGLKDNLNVLFNGRDIYTPIKLNTGTNAVYFKGADELLSSGYLWEDVRKQLAYKPFTVVQPRGRGFVIGFTAEPTRRAYLDGLNLLYMNAIFRAAAQARPVR